MKPQYQAGQQSVIGVLNSIEVVQDWHQFEKNDGQEGKISGKAHGKSLTVRASLEQYQPILMGHGTGRSPQSLWQSDVEEVSSIALKSIERYLGGGILTH